MSIQDHYNTLSELTSFTWLDKFKDDKDIKPADKWYFSPALTEGKVADYVKDLKAIFGQDFDVEKQWRADGSIVVKIVGQHNVEKLKTKHAELAQKVSTAAKKNVYHSLNRDGAAPDTTAAKKSAYVSLNRDGAGDDSLVARAPADKGDSKGDENVARSSANLPETHEEIISFLKEPSPENAATYARWIATSNKKVGIFEETVAANQDKARFGRTDATRKGASIANIWEHPNNPQNIIVQFQDNLHKVNKRRGQDIAKFHFIVLPKTTMIEHVNTVHLLLNEPIEEEQTKPSAKPQVQQKGAGDPNQKPSSSSSNAPSTASRPSAPSPSSQKPSSSGRPVPASSSNVGSAGIAAESQADDKIANWKEFTRDFKPETWTQLIDQMRRTSPDKVTGSDVERPRLLDIEENEESGSYTVYLQDTPKQSGDLVPTIFINITERDLTNFISRNLQDVPLAKPSFHDLGDSKEPKSKPQSSSAKPQPKGGPTQTPSSSSSNAPSTVSASSRPQPSAPYLSPSEEEYAGEEDFELVEQEQPPGGPSLSGSAVSANAPGNVGGAGRAAQKEAEDKAKAWEDKFKKMDYKQFFNTYKREALEKDGPDHQNMKVVKVLPKPPNFIVEFEYAGAHVSIGRGDSSEEANPAKQNLTLLFSEEMMKKIEKDIDDLFARRAARNKK